MTIDDGPIFELRSVAEGDHERVVVSGELDMATAPELEERLTALHAAQRPVVVDLSNLQFMDSSGHAALIKAVRLARRDDWSFAIDRRLPRQVERLFEVTGTDRVFPLAGAVPDGV